MPRPPSCLCGSCKLCKGRAYTNLWRERNRERFRELQAASYQRHAEQRREDRRRYREENREQVLAGERAYTKKRPRYKANPEKVRAQNIVNQAIAAGKLHPQPCEGCGASAYPTHDGRRGVHAHHDDYTKPLDVRWLCYACHGKEHRTYG